MRITRHAEARAVLADSRYVPPPAPQDAEEGTLAWLRSRVSRFSSGAVHAERRHRLSQCLDTLDPVRLREAARSMTAERDGVWQGVPTAVLGAALGIADLTRLVELVDVAAGGYLSGEQSPEADAAVADLVKLVGPDDTIPKITLLLQGHASTEGLIGNALRHTGSSVDDLLHETLRHDPPLAVTKRVTGDAAVEIDLVAANRDPEVFPDPDRFDPGRGATAHLTFGHGVRPCPASAHALAIAAGVIEGIRA